MPNDEENESAVSKDEEDLLKIVNSSGSGSSNIKKDMEPSREGYYDALADLRNLVNNYYKVKNATNIALRKKYFNCSFALIFILVFSFIGTTIMVCLFIKDSLATIISLVGSIGGLVPSVLILPRIIGEYLFPHNEYDPARDAIESGKNIKKDK